MSTEITQLLVAIIFTGVCLLIAFVITTHTFYQLFVQDASEWINKTYRYLTIVIMISFTFCTIGDIIHMTWYVSTLSDRLVPYHPFGNLISVPMDAFYFCGNVLFYVLILLRIAIPFKLNKIVALLLGMVIFLFTCVGIIYCVFIGIWYGVVLALSIQDLILSPLILGIFIYKMRMTIIHIDPSSSRQAETNVNVIANVMTKHSLLFGIAIFVNQGFYAVLIWQHFADKYGVLAVYCIEYSVRAFENVINVTILWLILRVNYSKYIGLCNCCHKCIGKCCFKNIDYNPAINNAYQTLMDDNISANDALKN